MRLSKRRGARPEPEQSREAHSFDRQRFPRSVFGAGREPDVRFSLANERTFLAWIRTALALIAGGVALDLLGLDLQPALRLAASTLLVAAGIVLPILSWFGWASTERALRHERPLPHPPLGVLLAIVVGAVAVLVLLSISMR